MNWEHCWPPATEGSANGDAGRRGPLLRRREADAGDARRHPALDGQRGEFRNVQK